MRLSIKVSKTLGLAELQLVRAYETLYLTETESGDQVV